MSFMQCMPRVSYFLGFAERGALPFWERAIEGQRLPPHWRRYRRQLPSPTSPRMSLFSQARRRRRQYLLSYWTCSITPCPAMPSRAIGAAEAAERPKGLRPMATIVPRITDRITSSLRLTSPATASDPLFRRHCLQSMPLREGGSPGKQVFQMKIR